MVSLSRKSFFKTVLKKKHILWCEYLNRTNSVIHSKYIEARNKVAKLSSSLRRDYEKQLTNNFNTPKSIKRFFQYAKNQLSNDHRDISLMDSNG